MFDSILNILLVAFAFGFVIFWHELGHFLAARWAGVRVEQFAVGMGQALVSWRKGIGFRFAGFGKKGFHWGSTQDEFDARVKAELDRREREGERLKGRSIEPSVREKYDVAKDIGIGETEYRLSWVPLGGYVKPTGQDDLRPAAEVGRDDPHAFGAKPVGKRMVIIGAGVVMNVILAFALYVILFMYGFNSPPAVVGYVMPGSPAQKSGLQVGDRILTINGDEQQDYTKINMNVSLLRDDVPAEFIVQRHGESEPVKLSIQPTRSISSFNMPAIGVLPSYVLIGEEQKARGNVKTPEDQALPPGARVSKINGVEVGEEDYHKLDQAIQNSDGKPVDLTIVTKEGETRPYALVPSLRLARFGAQGSSIAGLLPRVGVSGVLEGGPADKAGIKAGDVFEQVAIVETGETKRPPSILNFRDWVDAAGQKGRTIRLSIRRDGAAIPPIEVLATEKSQDGKKAIQVLTGSETTLAIAGDIIPNTPAERAGIKAGEQIIRINDMPVTGWFDVIRVLRAAGKGEVKVALSGPHGARQVTMQMGEEDAAALTDMRYAQDLPLKQLIKPRKTSNPLTAAKWGIIDTKFSIIQVYQTLQRLFQGTVPVSNLSGPIGIFTAGTSAADRGMDYLIWFAALISANLAVVNFLPIPIVDGGLFVFLLAEKITGKPPSPRVQTAAQLIGLVLLGSLFLFVTYHDVMRNWG